MLRLTAVALLLSCSPSPSVKQGVSSGVVANVTKHANLGFTADVPFGQRAKGTVLGATIWDIEFNGSAKVLAKVATDLALSYDAGQLVGGGSLPFQLTYTPAAGASLAVVDVAGTLTIHSFPGCGISMTCPATVPITIAKGQKSFTAPLGSDPSVTVPGSSSTITISVLGLDFVKLSVSTSLTLDPVASGFSGWLPGLAGAAAGVSAAGATLTSFPLVEWDSSGQTVSGAVQLPPTLENGFGLALDPLVHWVGTSGDATLHIDFTDAAKVILDVASAGICIFDCSIPPITLFSGGLGPVYTSAGLDTQIGTAVGGVAGPLIAGRVASGFVPIPLFSPELPTIPPIPSSLGAVTFGAPGVAITGAPATAVLAGSSITLGSTVNGGTSPFVYHWSKNGAPFGSSTATLTDAPGVGVTTYALYVTDADGGVSNTASVSVNGYDFSIALAPSSQTIPFGASTTYTVTVVLTGGSGLSGVPTSVATALSGLPTGGSAVGFPASLSLSTAPSSATFTVNTLQTTPVGTFTLTGTGTTGTGSRTGHADLVIITPAQAAQNLLDTIAGMGFPKGEATSLAASLGTLIDHINAGNTSASCGKLGAFVNKVNADLGAGRLTPAQAAQLLLLASQIQASLGC